MSETRVMMGVNVAVDEIVEAIVWGGLTDKQVRDILLAIDEQMADSTFTKAVYKEFKKRVKEENR